MGQAPLSLNLGQDLLKLLETIQSSPGSVEEGMIDTTVEEFSDCSLEALERALAFCRKQLKEGGVVDKWALLEAMRDGGPCLFGEVYKQRHLEAEMRRRLLEEIADLPDDALNPDCAAEIWRMDIGTVHAGLLVMQTMPSLPWGKLDPLTFLKILVSDDASVSNVDLRTVCIQVSFINAALSQVPAQTKEYAKELLALLQQTRPAANLAWWEEPLAACLNPDTLRAARDFLEGVQPEAANARVFLETMRVVDASPGSDKVDTFTQTYREVEAEMAYGFRIPERPKAALSDALKSLGHIGALTRGSNTLKR